MSFIHWAVRTIVVAFVIIVTRIIYLFLVTIVENKFLSVVICVICLIVIAETLKVKTNLNKNYW